MFSVRQKREIAEAVQKILRDTKHHELPEESEIEFKLYVQGRNDLSYPCYADIRNNRAVYDPSINSHNEIQDKR